MALQLIHTFTAISGNIYYVSVDFDTGQIETIWDPPSNPADDPVTEVELGFTIGDVIASRCNFGDKWAAIAQIEFPFVSILIYRNHPDCDIPAPLCDYEISASGTGSTNNNANGSITVTATQNPIAQRYIFQYSLDNNTWQTSPVFQNLFAGTYYIYVRTQNGCIKSTILSIGNTNTILLPGDVPWEDSKRVCYWFKLIINGISHKISEPIKWDDVDIIGERDSDFHGYQFKYTDGNVDLGFDCPAGRELIEAEYAEHGQDGEVLFQYGFTYNLIDYILFPGKLMLNTLKTYPEKVECTVESTELDTTFTSRMETKISMTETESHDGLLVIPPTAYNLELHSKQIFTRLLSERPGQNYNNFSYTQGTRHIYIKPDNTNPQYSDIRENFQYPLGTQILNPYDVDEYVTKFFVGGIADININLNFLVDMRRQNKNDDPDIVAYLYVVKKKYSTSTGTYLTTTIDITTTPVVGRFNNNGYFTFNIAGTYQSLQETFSPGDQVFVYMDIYMDRENKVLFQNVLQNIATIDIKYTENSIATNANVWFLEDVIKHCVNVITSNGYSLKSSFFERMNASQLLDGCGSKYVLTNGFQIRQFEVADRPLKIDLKKVLWSANGIFCIGIHYIKDDNGSFVRIERADYFYQNVEIISIHNNPSEYKEEVANDIIYNELEFGYNKFQEDGYNSLDEFNTNHELLTPIKKNKKKLSKKADFITSGYSIEDIRREQFAQNPSSSVTNDEEPFMISVKRETSTDFVTEKDEAFDVVTGIISPETAYNLRISPKRILYNWFIWIKGIFAYKENDDKIKVTKIIQNSQLVTQFNADEQCRVGDIDRYEISERDPISMLTLGSTRDIYRPERVTIKCKITPDKITTLNLAMTGRSDGNKNHGYIMVKNHKNIWQAVWVTKLKYNFWSQKAEITGLKKFTSPSVPNDEVDCCKWVSANGCYILANGERIVA
jgi:hypothetical protein